MKITVHTKYGTYTHEYEDGDDDTIEQINEKWECMLLALGYSPKLVGEGFYGGYNDAA